MQLSKLQFIKKENIKHTKKTHNELKINIIFNNNKKTNNFIKKKTNKPRNMSSVIVFFLNEKQTKKSVRLIKLIEIYQKVFSRF